MLDGFEVPTIEAEVDFAPVPDDEDADSVALLGTRFMLANIPPPPPSDLGLGKEDDDDGGAGAGGTDTDG